MMTARYMLAAGISLLALSTPVQAQTREGSPTEDPRNSTSGGEDIVVTATRREETLLDVPLSLLAFDQKSLDTKTVRNIEDLARISPGVTLNQGFSGTRYISIRGITANTGAATTGIYIDETPVQVRSLSLQTNFYPSIFDLERVEVLRGPQGTLFGAGAEGGAIRFILAQPGLKEYSGAARAEVGFTKGGDPSYEAGGAIGGPIVQDRLGFRISAYHRRDGGYIDRVPYLATRGTAKENSNSRETTTVNAALTFAPTDTLSITPSVFYQRSRQNDTDQYWRLLNQPNYPRLTSGEGISSYNRDEATIYAVKARWDIGGSSLISNTAFIDRDTRSVNDFTAYSLDVLSGSLGSDLTNLNAGGLENSFNDLPMRQRSFTQELRLQSDGITRLGYVLGVFYQNTRQVVTERDINPNFDTFITAVLGVPPLLAFGANAGPSGVFFTTDNSSRDRQIAGFAQLDYKLTDRLTATAGVRVSEVKFDFASANGGAFNGGRTTTAAGRSSETPVTPKFGLEYKPDANWLLYASASKGFRPGGANPLANTATCAADLAVLGRAQVPASYTSDSVWSYEVGIKGRAARGVTVAGSAFTIDWSDIQRGRVLPRCAAAFIDNLGSARVRGFDALVSIMPITGLSFDANVSYTDATFRQTIATLPGGQSGTIVRRGDRFSSPWNLALSGDYQTALSSSASAYGHVEWNYRSGYSIAPGNFGALSALLDFDKQSFVSARVGLRRGGVDLSVFANNLLNSRDVLGRQQLSPVSTRVLEQTFRPRTIGLTAGYRF
jgi:outer membrane receptor protein involved in Fe transport